MRPPDPAFADPRLAVLYDALDGGRSDLDAYVAMADEVDARTVVDIGCGTGALATRLAGSGRKVVGVDPARASLDVARTKPFAERVTWVHGDATALLDRAVTADLAVMTGNVAQALVSDDDWQVTLDAVGRCLKPAGWFAFETRRAEARDWERWDEPATAVRRADGSTVIVSRTVTEVAPPLVSFVTKTSVAGEIVWSTSTLRFRDRREIEQDLQKHGFTVVDFRDAPDRPGKEMVFLCRRTVP